MGWVQAFGAYQERPQEGETDYTKTKAGGMLAGIDLPANDGIRSGLYIGGISGKTNIGKETYRSIDSDGALAGGYLGKSFGDYFVSGQLDAGALNNDSARKSGVDTASASYNSYFVSPALTVMRPMPAKSCNLCTASDYSL